MKLFFLSLSSLTTNHTTMKTKNIHRLQTILIIFSSLLIICCKSPNRTTDLHYSDSQLWYGGINQSGDKAFDIFYILPTCVLDRTNSKGDTLHYANPLLKIDREAMRPSFELAKEIFGGNANFYAPYYRQLALQSWRSDSLINVRFPYSFRDVKQAFSYYMKNANHGRPFILAGFSQGGKSVVELLKTLTDKQYSQLIAAYVIGYKVTTLDTLNYKQIRPAKSKDDTGVTICYNSVSTTDAVCPVLSPSAICINPISWSITSNPASLNDTVTVRINKVHNVLIVAGYNPDRYYDKSLDFLFKKGNYHLHELLFYQNNLSENVKERYLAFSR